MRLSCPACQTEYDVPDAALTGRARTLRCGHCDHQWQVAPLAGAAPAAAAFVTGMALPEPPARMPEPPSRFEESRNEPPRPARNGERPGTPVSFVPEPAAAVTSKRKYPIPDPPARESADRYDTKSTAKLTYDTPAYDYANDRPASRAPRQGANPWLVSILLLLIAVAMVWIERFHIMRIWPPSTRLFDAITVLLQQLLHHK